jgi:uncharacterized protein YjbI with pentapeptide repeats
MLADALLHGASLGGISGLADTSLRGASLSGTLLLAGALLRGVSLSITLPLADASQFCRYIDNSLARDGHSLTISVGC